MRDVKMEDKQQTKQYIVYMHKNTINQKIYIGITSTTLERRAGCNGNGYRKNVLFYRAIQKYGWDAFEHIVLSEGLTKSEATEKEKCLIQELKANNPNYGYNISSGGESGHAGCTMSDEEREWRKKRYSGKGNPMYGKTKELSGMWGKKHKPESIQKMKEAQKGRIISQEHRQKISKTKKTNGDWSGNKNPMYGKTGDKAPQARRILCVETGIEYNCIKFAANELNICSPSISACCKGKVNTAGGFHWQYIN